MDADEAERLAEVRQDVRQEQRRGEVLGLLQRLRVGGDAFAEERVRDPLPYLAQAADASSADELHALQAYELLRQTCSGVSAVEAVCGRARLALTFDGLDLLDVLPVAPAVQALLGEVDLLRAQRSLKPRKE